MMRSMVSKRSLLALFCAASLSLSLAACGGDDDDDGGSASGSGSGTSTEAGGEVAVTIEGFEFSAQPVSAGSSFEVENKDSTEHTFTADDGAFDVDVDGGDTESVDAPADPGTYAFHCKIHPNMTGDLTVQ
jgi:plastocyanin